MGNLAVIVADQSMTKIVCATSIEVLWIALALQNINVSKARHFFEVACRAIARNKSMAMDRASAYGSEARNVAIWLAWQNSGLTLREIGSMFGGMDYAAVSQRIRRIQKRAATDKKLKRTLEMLNV